MNRKSLRLVVMLLVPTLILVLLAACAPAPAPAPQVVKETVVVEKSVEMTVVVEKPVEKTVVVEKVVTAEPTKVPKGGAITEVNPHDVRCLNPILCGEGSPGDYFPKMYGRCVDIDANTGEWVGDLCDKWEVSADAATYKFHIRPDLKWTDGTPITAKDFAYTYEALMSGKVETFNVAAVQNIKEVNVIDDANIEFVLKGPDCAALQSLSLRWIPAHVYKPDFSDLTTSPEYLMATVTSGPFKLKEWVRGDHVIWEPNANYWKGEPNVSYIRRVVPNQVVGAQQMKTGEADVAPIVPENVAELESEDSLTVYKYLRDAYAYVALQMGDPNNPQPRLNADGSVNANHGAHPILSDKKVRQAMAHAIDRNAMINNINLGLAGPMVANVLPTIKWAYASDLPLREVDPEKAKALLDEAGWKLPDGAKVRQCDGCATAAPGTPLKLTLLALAGYELSENRAILIQDELNSIGFDIQVEMLESAAYRERRLAQTWDMAIQDHEDLGNDPNDDFLWAGWSDVPTNGMNFVSYYNPDLEKLLLDAKQVPGCDIQKRGELYKEIQKIIADDVPYIFLNQRKDVLAYNKRIGDFKPGPWYYEPNQQNWYIIGQ